MPISTIGQNGLNAPITLTSPVINNITSASATALTLQSAGTTAITVDASQRVAFVAGTAALPAITTTGDTNTGIFFPAADTIAFSEGGAEAMRIASDNRVYIACTSAPSATVSGVRLGNPNEALCAFSSGATTSETYQLGFYNGNGLVGRISTNGSATSYTTSSDYRLKENITPMTGALAKVALLKPVTYKWKADGSDGEGFIAHELQAVIPDAVVGEKDAVDASGNIKSQGIDTSFLVATLTAAIQELKTIVDAQAAEIAELKAKVA